jgi:hypothetical protein
VKAADLINEINEEIVETVRYDGYQILAINVLRRALIDVVATEPLASETQHGVRRVRSEALDWFLVDKPGFTFTLVCDLLHMDRGETLEKIKRWIAKGDKVGI